MRLARKLTLALAAAMVAILFATGIVWIRREIELVETDAREDLSIIGRALRPALVRVWTVDGHEQARALLEYADQRMRRVDIRWVRLDAPTGDRDAPRVPTGRLANVRSGEDTTIELPNGGVRRLVHYLPVVSPSIPPGALELSQSLDRERAFVRESAGIVAVAIGGAAVLAVFLTVVLGAWLVGKPMRRLAEQARRIGAGDLTRRVKIAQRDEIGEVAAEMNAMCEHLLAARERLASEAEARVATLVQLRHAERLSTVGKLAAGIAHELGTPLAVVAGHGKMIATGQVAGADAAASARVIAEQAGRMTRIIRELLGFARRRGANKQPADLVELARATLTLLAPMAEKRAVTLRLEVEARPFVVSVDAGQMQQALANLLVNAIEASSDAEVVIAAGRRVVTPPAELTRSAAEHAFLEVRDRGRGIAPEDLPRVLEPFFTTKGVGEGTGLGLSVTHGIVQEHGGWIDADSAPGEGSRFTIFLPAGDSR